jgi:hypothetical protein
MGLSLKRNLNGSLARSPEATLCLCPAGPEQYFINFEGVRQQEMTKGWWDYSNFFNPIYYPDTWQASGSDSHDFGLNNCFSDDEIEAAVPYRWLFSHSGIPFQPNWYVEYFAFNFLALMTINSETGVRTVSLKINGAYREYRPPLGTWTPIGTSTINYDFASGSTFNLGSASDPQTRLITWDY